MSGLTLPHPPALTRGRPFKASTRSARCCEFALGVGFIVRLLTDRYGLYQIGDANVRSIPLDASTMLTP